MTYEERIILAKEKINNAEFILIGGAAGLSTAAGLDYGGERFLKYFSYYKEKYGITNMYSAMFYPFKTPEEEWAYKALHTNINRFEMGPTQLYNNLYSLVKEKNYFILTTNGDHQFFLTGFENEKIFATQGDYDKFQCSVACHDTLYDTTKQIKQMVESTQDFKMPSSLIPTCPNCGKPMMLYLRIDKYFIENETWKYNQKRYQSFLKEIENQKGVLLEIGVGFNTPGIIKYPFEQLVYENPLYSLIRINKNHPQGAPENVDKTIAFTEDTYNVINDLRRS